MVIVSGLSDGATDMVDIDVDTSNSDLWSPVAR